VWMFFVLSNRTQEDELPEETPTLPDRLQPSPGAQPLTSEEVRNILNNPRLQPSPGAKPLTDEEREHILDNPRLQPSSDNN
ncbi:MAG: hypothetical protein MN733_17040, partial [Nitrososphaera sp.]|nr:hypothetical protein [Nitrososphaera sp.]